VESNTEGKSEKSGVGRIELGAALLDKLPLLLRREAAYLGRVG